MVLRIHTQGEVQASIAAGGWTIAWGSLVTDDDLVELSAPLHSDNTFVWVTLEINAQLKKFDQSLDTVSLDVVHQASQFLSDLHWRRYPGEAEIAGLGVKAGIAEYYDSSRTVNGSSSFRRSRQPYFGLRVTKALPLKESSWTVRPATYFDSNAWYKIINKARPGMSLDVVNDGNQMRDGRLKLATDGNYSGQYWQLRPSGSDPETYTLCTMWLGSGMRLDTTINLRRNARLAAIGPRLEQQWRIECHGDEIWKLRNVRSTEMLSADASGKDIFMTDDQTSPLCDWVLQRARTITERGFGI